jgi:hypothetical protein
MRDSAETRSTQRASGANYATSVSVDGELFGYGPSGSTVGWKQYAQGKRGEPRAGNTAERDYNNAT